MSILSIVRDYGVKPCIVRMLTNDTYATMTTAGYLNDQMAAYNVINGGAFQWDITDVILADYANGQDLFVLSADFSSLEDFFVAGGGTVTSVAMTVPSFLSVSGSPITSTGTLAVSYSGSALPIANGGTAKTSVTTSPLASSWSGWDANSNLSANNFLSGYATTATAAATTTLLVSSAQLQYFTGTTTQTVKLPVTSTLVLGQSFYIVNNSSGVVTVESSGSNTIQAMVAKSTLLVTCILTSGTTAASWNAQYIVDSDVSDSITTIDGDSGSVTPTAGLVTISGGVTGLTTIGSGSTLDLTGTLAIANGGTGLTALGTGVQTALGQAVTGTAGIVLQGSPVINTPFVETGLTDGAGNFILTLNAVAGGINNLQITNDSSHTPTLSSVGTGNINIGYLTQNNGIHYFQSENTTPLIIASGTTYQKTTNFQFANTSGTNIVTWPDASGTVAFTGSSAETFDGDSGSATPSAGVITISGGSTGLTTSASSATLNITGTLKLANGGTNASLTASNGGIFYSTASAGAILAGTATATQMLQSGSSTTPAWSTTTWPATSTINQLLYSSSENTITGLATATTAVLTTSSGVPTWANELSLALGGTNAALTASNGGIFYSTASAGAILAGTATAAQLLMSGSSTAPTWSTSTYPATNAVNTLLYASSANTMAALTAGANGVLISSNSNVPSWLANGTAGYILTAQSGAPPSWQAAPASAALVWAVNSNSSISGAVGNGYILTSGSATTVTLPTTFAVGTQIGVQGEGSSWTVDIGASTNVKGFGNTYTTSIASANNTDSVVFIAIVANTTWAMLSLSTTGFTAS